MDLEEARPTGTAKIKKVLRVKGRPVVPLMEAREFYSERGRRIHKKRIALGLTRRELAQLTGYTENSIKGIEVRGRGMSLYKWWLFERVLGEL